MSRYYSSILNVLSPSFLNTYSLAFDGVDDFVKTSLDGTSTGGILPASDSDIELTISFWFYMDGSQSLKGIFQWGNSLIDTTPTLLVNTDGASIRTFVDGSYRHTSGITMNVWHHYAITRTASTNTWQGYIDGVSAFTANDGGTLNDRASAIDFYFGVGYNGYLNGKIDEAAFWNSVQDVAAIYNSGVPNDLTSLNPTAWYRMGDNGSYKSPQWLIPNNSNVANSRISNYSFSYDGVDDVISMGNVLDFDYNEPFTISAWINLEAFSYSFAGVVSKQEASGNFRGYHFDINETSGVYNLRFSLNHTLSNRLRIQGTTDLIGLGWTHIACTYDGSADVSGVKLYINGNLESLDSGWTLNTLGSNTTLNSASFNLGSRSGSRFFEGNIDEVSVFNTALTSENVTAIYNSGVPTTLPVTPIAHWKLGEEATFSTNWTIPDGVGSADGLSENMTIEDRVGNASSSTSNAVSFNMTESDRETDVPS